MTMTERGPRISVGRYSRLGRVLSWRYPSHRFALVGSAFAGAIGFLVGGLVDGEWNFIGAFFTGVAVFLAWACAREIDPDRNLTAGLALVLATPLAIWNRPSLLLVVVALLGLRLMVGTVGGTLQTADYVAVLAGAAAAGSRPEGWGIVLLLVAATLGAQPRFYLLLGSGILGVGALSAMVFDASLPDQIQTDGLWAWQLLVVVAMVVSLRENIVASRTDIGKKNLSLARLKSGRLFAGLAVAGGLLSSVSHGPTVLGPLVAALVSTAAIAVLFPSRTNA